MANRGMVQQWAHPWHQPWPTGAWYSNGPTHGTNHGQKEHGTAMGPPMAPTMANRSMIQQWAHPWHPPWPTGARYSNGPTHGTHHGQQEHGTTMGPPMAPTMANRSTVQQWAHPWHPPWPTGAQYSNGPTHGTHHGQQEHGTAMGPPMAPIMANRSMPSTLPCQQPSSDPSSLYDFTMLDITKTRNISLSDYRGKQEPGSESEILQAVKYVRPGGGFVPNFQMFAKIDVNGKSEVPLYTYLKNHCPPTTATFTPDYLMYTPIHSSDVAWNWETFLVGRFGQVVSRAPSALDPMQWESAILRELSSTHPSHGGAGGSYVTPDIVGR
ncbi:hypothetical protein ACOMHN_009681 [Nucella lapillus]